MFTLKQFTDMNIFKKIKQWNEMMRFLEKMRTDQNKTDFIFLATETKIIIYPNGSRSEDDTLRLDRN